MAVMGVAFCAAASLLCSAAALLLTGARPPSGAAGALRARVSELSAVMLAIPAVRAVRQGEERARRRASCLEGLPLMLDVLTLGLSAGLSFDAALDLYCGRYETDLSHALGEAMLCWRLGIRSREQALALLAEDLGVPAFSRFAQVVSEALAFGTPLASALERQAQAIRDEQRSQVEEEIERVPVKMLLPLGTLIVPAMFLAILGPLLGSTLTIG